ncbi:Molybdopterin or thiamine biosynthesis adenylyltransferase [Desulfonatronum zhilinae]|nr:Molybdopterin or thiamine biosynthesis adenylyltransferase [Desulfonatronum zhilinae]
MDREALTTTLQSLGINSAQTYRESAFSRNIGLFSPGEQERLAQVRAAIPGMGGVGGGHLINLVRTGFGRFHLADFDHFEPVNVNRQYGAAVPSFGRPKLEVLASEALAINPFLDLKLFDKGLTLDNLEAFLTGVDVVLDGLDFFQFEIRRALFNTARAMGIPVITAGPLGYSSALLIFSPLGMSFDEYFDVQDSLPAQEKYLRFAMGLAPSPTHIAYMDLSRVDLEGGKGPSLNIACQLCSALAATEAVRIALGKPELKPAPHFVQFDPYRQTLRKGRLIMGNRSPFQRAKILYVRHVLQATQRARPVVPKRPAMPGTAGELPVDALTYLIRAGIQAPSGDNAQPWKFSRTTDAIDVYLNPQADESFFNIRQTASVIACGAAVENIRLAAGSLGLESAIDLLPPSENDNLMATIRLSPGACQSNRVADPLSNPLTDQIWNRCTNRRPYRKDVLPDWLQADLQQRIQDIPGARLHLLTTRPLIRRVARMVYLADRIRTEHQGLHEHFTSMVRFAADEARRSGDGLPLKNLEAGWTGELFLRLTKPWPVMRAVNRIGLGRMVAMHSAQAILASGAVGMVVVSGMERRDFLQGGQALQRIWLALEHHGLRMQPMTALTLFHLRWKWDGPGSFSDTHQRLLEQVWQAIPGVFPDVDFQRQGLCMLFRTGYGPGIRHRTPRKDVGDFLIK